MTYSTILDRAGWKAQLPVLSSQNLDVKEALGEDDNEDEIVYKVVEGVLSQFENETFFFPSLVSSERVKRTPRYLE